MHEGFGHSLKVKIFYLPFRLVDLDFGDNCEHENNFRNNVEKRQTMQCKFEKSQKKVQQIIENHF